MSGILDKVIAQGTSRFYPNSIREFFALRLAQKLGDAVAVRHYLGLIERFSEEQILVAYRRAASSSKAENWARAFHTALEHMNGTTPRCPSLRLLAVKVERRAVSIAVFTGTQIDYTQTRHLTSTWEKAEGSAIGFATRILQNFEVDSAALERIPAQQEIQRIALTRSIKSALRGLLLPVWEIDKHLLLKAFGTVPLRSRRELREVVQTIWPILGDDDGILDASALGLFIQVERMFSCES